MDEVSANDNKTMRQQDAHRRLARTHWKPVFRWSAREKKFRIGRLIWTTEPGPGAKGGFSQKLSLALWAKPFSYDRGRFHWCATFLFVCVHYRRAYGGWIV